MGKIFITTNDSLRQLQYDAVTNISKMVSKYDTMYRCPRDHKIRIDALPGTIYHTRTLITNEQFEELKDLGLKLENTNKGETFAYGLLVAKALRGTGSRKGPLFNVLANLHLTEDLNVNDLLVKLTEGGGYALCYPHTTDKEIRTDFMFQSETEQDIAIRSIIKYEVKTSAEAVANELEYFIFRKPGESFLINSYFDGDMMVADRAWSLK